MRSRQLEARLCPSDLNRRPVESVFDGKDAFVWLPTADPESLSACRSCLTRSLAETTALLSLFTAIFSSSLQRLQLTFALRTNVLRQTVV